ncbi:MAG: hypothetical protein DRP09_16495 [Candidatus Thorarchaeota archaeon]|nr:MAG: hypothetical protein DRP09_16495 [Candidatus Thorarchaeota archaeon]
MLWTSFLGAFAGAAIGVLALIGIIVVWDYFAQRKENQASESSLTLDSILESHLEEYITAHFETLFPGWKTFDDSPESKTKPDKNSRPTGIRYRTSAGEIDILCIDRQGDFVVIELKRHKAPDRVVSQIDRYIAWVKQNLAKPGQRVKGLIIAKSLGSRLSHTLSRRRGIRIWTYRWQLKLDKRPNRKM